MSGRHEIPARTRDQQTRASDPEASAWVSANAGSGKTTVLVRRVIRLLLAGFPPARILCLTFTKSAAAHMANEVLKTLGAWVRLDDQALDRAIAEVSPLKLTPELRAQARRLFAAALETPGGLKVQTIHAFCDRVLHQFPFEARVPAGFEVLDEVREADLLTRARNAVLIEVAAEPEGALGRALAHAVTVASDQSLAEALAEAVRARRNIMGFIEQGGEQAIAAALGLESGESVASVETKILSEACLPHSEWGSVAATLAAIGGNAARCGRALARAAAGEQGTAIKEYFSVFFTGEGEPRDDGGFGGEKARKSESVLFDKIIAERDRLKPLRDKWLAAQARERTAALIVLAGAMIRRYEQAKRARGVLDYADLIHKTAAMLDDITAAWVLYKLDGGIDHILIDEAQDTSPEQWDVIARLAEEFFAGRGARADRARTIFAVGDEKQSIFGFQGANPAYFDLKRREFKKLVEAAGSVFHPERLDLSFRSAPGVLNAIDTIFKREAAYVGLTGEKLPPPPHVAIRAKAPALVEIWPTVKPATDTDEGLAWDAPLDAKSESSPPVILAQHIAKAMKFWIAGGLSVGDGNNRRTPCAGDVIILVRRRGPLFEAILQALKRADVAVAGADRLELTKHIAVMDLIALGDALALQTDDLALACALKSPLLDLGEDELFALAHGRSGTLAAALAEKARDNPRFAAADQKLRRWREEARALRPFDFFARVLGRDRGRERFLARLGIEAADALDEFLARALAYETTETPSLTGFLAFLRRAGTEVKRDLEVESQAVRVMTVHGAKGLEAPIIVLADTASLPDGRHDPKLLALSVPNAPPNAPQALLWGLKKESDSVSLRAARAAAQKIRADEYRRLLYVALTRAADALIVCGCESKSRDLLEDCWYRLVHDALKGSEDKPELIETKVPYFDQKVWRWRPEALGAVKPRIEKRRKKAKPPAWLEKSAPAARPPLARIPPSSFDPDDERHRPDPQPSVGSLDARTRGALIHRLLQSLPELPMGKRKSEAERWLAQTNPDLPAAARVALVAEAIAVIEHPALAVLFGAKSRAEVELMARLPGMEIPGRIDRLAVSPEAVWIADYKTDATPPESPHDAPENYVKQLALYRAALEKVYPEKALRAYLIWTAAPAIHEIPAARLAAALKHVTSA